jgi:hypothetical protein
MNSWVRSSCWVLFFQSSELRYFFGQKDFFSAFPIYSLAFGMMVCIYRSNYSLRTIVVTGLIIRIVLLFSMPGFSDDVYRFYWDGRLILEGINPYGVLPAEVVNFKLKYLDGDLFPSVEFSAILYYLSTFQSTLFCCKCIGRKHPFQHSCHEITDHCNGTSGAMVFDKTP